MKLVVTMSQVKDGDMTIRKNNIIKDVITSRENFFTKNNISMLQTTHMRTTYDSDNYNRYIEVGDNQKGVGMFDNNAIIADAIITKDLDHALFITVADCIGAVIYDPTKQILMLCHLGRHSIESNGAYKSVEYLIGEYGCNTSELLVWLTPAPGQQNYPLFAFNGHSMKDITLKQLALANIITDNITDSSIDTSLDLRYFSYSEFLRGNRKMYGNNAIVAMIKS
jgi:hypothetical protein